MPVITAITPQRRRQERVSVFLDEEFWTGMTAITLAMLDLQVGNEISEARRKELEQTVAETDALDWCINLLMQRMYSKKILRDKLAQREYPEAIADIVMERLEELLLVNDEIYAQNLALGKRATGQGRRRVEQTLREKGIDKELRELTLDETFPPDDEAGLAGEALRYRFGDLVPPENARRAYDFLVRRGFDPRVCSEVIAAHTDEDTSAEEDAGRALHDLRRRYHDLDPDDMAAQKKASAYLARRGFRWPVISAALVTYAEERAERA